MIQLIKPTTEHFTLLGIVMSDKDVVPSLPDRFLTLGGLFNLCHDIMNGKTVGALVFIGESLGVFFAEPGDIADEYIVHAYFQRGAWGKGLVGVQQKCVEFFASLEMTKTLMSYVPTNNRMAHLFNMRCGFRDVCVVDEGRHTSGGKSIPCWKMVKEI